MPRYLLAVLLIALAGMPPGPLVSAGDQPDTVAP
jgi:hypothetical protein